MTPTNFICVWLRQDAFPIEYRNTSDTCVTGGMPAGRSSVIVLLVSMLLLLVAIFPGMAAAGGGCSTNLLVDFNVAKKVGATLIQRSSSVSAGGNTPLAMAISAAAADLARESSEEKIIVVLSDGEETCEGDPVAAALIAKAAQVMLTTNIVGLAVSESTARQLEEIASATGGRYVSADQIDELQCKLRQALDGQPKDPMDAHRRFIEQRRSALENQSLSESEVVRVEQDTLDRMEKLIEDGNHITNMDAPEVAYARIKGEVAQARGKGQPVDMGASPSGDGSKTTKGAKSIKTKPSHSGPKSSRSSDNNGAPPCEVDKPERIPSRSIIVVLDTSGSMSKRLAGAKAAISGFVSSLRPKTRVALRTFGGSALSFQLDKDECDDKKIVSVQARVDGEKKDGKKRLVRAVDELVSFGLTTKHNGCSSLDVLWDFGDGNVSSEKTPAHTYDGSGNYDVKVKVVCDDNCNEKQDHLPLNVTKICGPDISAQLMNVLAEVRATFQGTRWTRQQKEDLCNAVRSYNPLKLHQTLDAWDICPLYLPYTYWLYHPKFKRERCGMPAKGALGKRAIETLPDSPCGNSVQVGDHCYLAGTVNYALFGEISRLCQDEFQDRLDISEMKRLILDWKWLDHDDPGPPIAWAVWAYHRRPLSDVPKGRAANRDYCERLCGEPVKLTFSWKWLPYQRTCSRW